MSNLNVTALIGEMAQTKSDSIDILTNIKSIDSVLAEATTNPSLSPEFRKISVPMIYSAWESHFTASIAVCFRALKDIDKSANEHSSTIRAIWLQQESFFSKYIDMIKNIYDIDAHKSLSEKMANMKKKVKKGHFKLTTDVLDGIDTFNSTGLNKQVNVDDLVMTFANVNKVVTEMNMDVIGLDHSNLDLSQLDGLVGLRNAFGHGQFTTNVGRRQFEQMLSYAEHLINGLYQEVEVWLNQLDSELKHTHIDSWRCDTPCNVSFRYEHI
ncbi:putative MAE-28990/MAE-18760-like HEPN domain-containing protein [Vibrio crassostreae]|nr:putative MAE-28990/MAE-18760-like HEPN domain-containing protein [Vibrio crassostreae]CAK2041011.1 putative MAE-28990/MAE-18760-like HEPN domain-containing protein [Vibrio crassostreae]CAK2345372.1 putative MAE-28990/MAE-18760-like HEPN domain-containing protein [Vibrio crassostreae]CAK2810391.1 putative MAE-28990/MAE-18760-like HEPN domain-containing protein [Vibrio crassostreae]CAK2882980.1 putative MAE-28990/MAE-18760-like HEPN domain-containing protein [Vibrio crassostreae]